MSEQLDKPDTNSKTKPKARSAGGATTEPTTEQKAKAVKPITRRKTGLGLKLTLTGDIKDDE